jgi:hypothetical protein
MARKPVMAMLDFLNHADVFQDVEEEALSLVADVKCLNSNANADLTADMVQFLAFIDTVVLLRSR